MAARLMMHYPDKVTCDDNTFQLSRLVPHHFDVLITKRMKGLRNVGIIREYIEKSDTFDVGDHSVPYFHYHQLKYVQFQIWMKLQLHI
jgi:adenylate cyclase 10